jgi:hypothetical protein
MWLGVAVPATSLSVVFHWLFFGPWLGGLVRSSRPLVVVRTGR